MSWRPRLLDGSGACDWLHPWLGKEAVGVRVVLASLSLGTPVLLWRLWSAVQVYRTAVITSCCGRNADHSLCGYKGPCQAAAGGHVTVFVAKEVVTMDPTWPTAKAVAVQDGRIIAVGQSVEDVAAWSHRQGVTHSIDETYKEHVLLPGFIEQHNHPFAGGTAMRLPSLARNAMPRPYREAQPAVRTRAEGLERIAAEAKKLPPGQDLNLWGWDSVAFGGHLTRHELDKVDNSRLIFVWDCSLHFGYLNSYGIRKMKLTPGKWGKTNGVMLDDDGELNGQFLGVTGMQPLNPCFLGMMQASEALESMHFMTELGRQNGITTMCELMHGGVHWLLETALYRHFYNHPSTPMRCVCVCDASKILASCLGSAWWATSWLRRRQASSTEKLIYNNGIKFFTDDAFLGLTMQMAYPGYTDGRKGLWNCGHVGARYALAMLPWWRAGCRVHVHSNGDAAQDATAEALAMLQRLCPRFDHRFCFEHYGMSNLHIHRRLKTLGASAAVNPYYLHHRADFNAPILGKDRAEAAARLRSIVDTGVPLALHTDTPVAPPRPLEEIWIAVNRPSESGKQACPGECVTPYEALKMKTVDAAYVHGLDGLLGSIEAGKLADFTVVDKSPLSVPPQAIRDIKVIATVVAGVKYANEPRPLEVPSPPRGGLGPLLWLLSVSSEGPALRWFWSKLASMAGCPVPSRPA